MLESMSVVEWIIALMFTVIAALLAVKISGLDQNLFKKKRTYSYFFGKEPRKVRIHDASYWGYEGEYELDRTRACYDAENHILYLKGIDQPLTDVVLWPQEGGNLSPSNIAAMMMGDIDARGDELELLGPTEHPIEKALAKKYSGTVNKPSHLWLDNKRTKDLEVLTTIKGEEAQTEALQSASEKEERFDKKLGDVVDKFAKITRPQERPPRT